MPARNVDFPSNGGRASGYLTGAAGKPGVVVVQEWWGLNAHIRSVADRLAEAGFLALAPDLYHGRATREPDEAGKLMMALNIDRAGQDLKGAAAYLLGDGGARGSRVGAIGFCMGGALAVYAATVAPELIGAVVDFYGGHPNVRPDYTRLSGPVQAHFGGKDTFVTPEWAAEIEQQIRAAGKQIEVHHYDGADHAFFNDERPEVFHQAAASQAWDRTLSFLRAHAS